MPNSSYLSPILVDDDFRRLALFFRTDQTPHVSPICVMQEHVGSLRAKAFEAKRWVLQKLDALSQAPGVDSDCDLEVG